MNAKIKIMIVEDSSIIAQLLRKELKLKGYEVCGLAPTGALAITMAKEKNPDVILMDIGLADNIDGIEAAEKIISYKNIPVIFLTGYNDEELKKRADKLNPAAYFLKPTGSYKLKAVIDSVMEKHYK
ncbi:MAG: response regulator [Candidatus Cloacimonadota bacterium]|nr:response regulator [Candidatus Cloacimonadota bacterium]